MPSCVLADTLCSWLLVIKQQVAGYSLGEAGVYRVGAP